jgi:pimeloyl-ACP methyl ester carboxylesterase
MAGMPSFSAPDGTELAYHVQGRGQPVVCLPGGPMRASAYLGDLGGLAEAAQRQLLLLDLRGTGESAVPADLASCRCDRQVADVEAFREHLGLERLTLLGHSAGGNLAALYAQRHPERVAALAQITPSSRAVGIPVTDQDRQDILGQRHDEPWFGTVKAALDRVQAGSDDDADWDAMAPMFYGRWDEISQAYDAADKPQTNEAAADEYFAPGAFDPPATRAALARLTAPVMLLGGGLDPVLPPTAATAYAELFEAAAGGTHAELVIQPGAGHAPWLDDAAAFTGSVAGFLNQAAAG